MPTVTNGSDARVGACWSCKGPVEAGAAACPTCGVVQPAASLIDHFARLGLPRGFAVDQAKLERAYVGAHARFHPDRFVRRAADERRVAAEQAVAVNEAYATLRDPLERARYLLALAGRPEPKGGQGTIDDPAVLMEAMETREALAEAEDAGAVAAVARRNADALAACREALADAFAAADLETAGRLTHRLAYLAKLADEVKRRRVAALGAAP